MITSRLPQPGFAALYETASRKLPVWPAVSIVVLLVLATVVLPALITGMDLCLLILAAVVWMASRSHLPRAFFEITLPFIAVCVVGLLSGIGADKYLYLKDAWYIVNPVVVIAVGFALYRAKPDLPRGLRAFVLGGTLVGITYIIPFILDPSLLERSASESRDLVGAGHFAPALAFLVMLSGWSDSSKSLRMPRWLVVVCMALCVTATVLSFSRTIALTTALGIPAIYGVFARRALLKISIAVLAFVLLVSAVRLTVDVDSSDAKRTFISKLARSIDEMKMQEYFDFKRINERYRGFESARALAAYEASGPARWIVGEGFGAELDLRVWVPGVGRFVPVLHNGYFYLLFKGGALAVLLFLFALWRMYAVGQQTASDERQSKRVGGRLLQGIALGLGLTTWVISGVFNKLEMYPFLLCAGFLIGYLTDPNADGTS
jgi:hypothetical protein